MSTNGSSTPGPKRAAGTPDQYVLAFRRPSEPLTSIQAQDPIGQVNPSPYAGPHSAEQAAGSFGFLQSLHLAFRGRYFRVIALGIVIGAACGFVTWRLAKPIYHSEGLLKIAYTLPEVIQETDQNKPLAQFDTFMLSQRMIISSHRILDQAIMDPVWKTSGRQVPDSYDRYFAKNLKVDTKPRSEYIQISVTDYDPGTAAVAVNSIISAYYDYFTSLSKASEQQRLSALEGKIAQIQSEIKSNDAEAARITKKYGTTKLDKFYDSAVAKVSRLENKLEDTRIAIATARPTAGESHAAPATQPAEISAELIARTDPVMRGYLDEESRVEKKLRDFRVSGLGEANKSVLIAKQDREEIRAKIQGYMTVARASHYGQSTADQRNADFAGKSIDDLRGDELKLVNLHEQAKLELAELVKVRRDVEPFEAKLRDLEEDLGRLTRRRAVLETEQSLGNSRLSIVSSAEIPLSPDRDFRPAICAAGALIGGLLPALFLFLRYRLTRRVYAYSDEAETDISPRVPLLGILPVLEEAEEDVEQVRGTAHSIHQIRVTLNAISPHNKCLVYLVTSATAGEGKTSVTMSLALSFVASRARTLVIDGDLVGRHFTNNLDAAEQDGLHEAIAEGNIDGLVQLTDSGVSVLTTGRASNRDACGIGIAKIRAILAQARMRYDVILIDTGPILGSVEAAVLAQEADSVIFTVARGQRRSLVDASLRRLDTLGVHTAGIIFNRAHSKDFSRSPYGSSAQSMVRDTESAPASRLGSLTRFGPVVQAVAMGVPASHN